MFVALWPTCRGLDTVIERAQVFLRSQEEGGVQPHQEMGKSNTLHLEKGNYRLRVHRFTAGAQGGLDTVIERAQVFSYVLKKKRGRRSDASGN